MNSSNKMTSSRVFGTLPDGRIVRSWLLQNAAGSSLEVIEYGGIVTRLYVPDREGKLADVVLGFDTLEPYLAGHPYFGVIAGRVAGRISGACFLLEGRTYELACNDPPNHLHGGTAGFDKKLWSAAPVSRPDGAASVRLTLESADGDEGYPGNLTAHVTFTLTARNEFIFETEVSTDRTTPASLTHHSYFNLAGESAGSATDHELQIFADTFAPTDAAMTLLGRRVRIGRSTALPQAADGCRSRSEHSEGGDRQPSGVLSSLGCPQKPTPNRRFSRLAQSAEQCRR